MIPTYSPVVNVDGAYSLIAYDTSRMVSGLPPRPAAQGHWPLPPLSLRILRTAVRWKIQRTEGLAMYGALRLNLALISPSAVRLVVVLSVLTSRPVLMALAVRLSSVRETLIRLASGLGNSSRLPKAMVESSAPVRISAVQLESAGSASSDGAPRLPAPFTVYLVARPRMKTRLSLNLTRSLTICCGATRKPPATSASAWRARSSSGPWSRRYSSAPRTRAPPRRNRL